MPPPTPSMPHASGVRRTGEEVDEAPATRRSAPNLHFDVRWVPLLVDPRALVPDRRRPITSMLAAAINGVLSVEDLSEVTGIPLGAVTDGLRDLEMRGIVAIDRRNPPGDSRR